MHRGKAAFLAVLLHVVFGTRVAVPTETQNEVISARPKIDTTFSNKNHIKEQFEETLKGLEEGLTYMWNSKSEVNLDGVIGIRMVEGQLEALFQHKPGIETALETLGQSTERLRDIQRLAGKAADTALEFVQLNEGPYFTSIGPLIERDRWNVWYESRPLDSTLAFLPIFTEEAMDEEQSDLCIREVLGTMEFKGQPCSVSDRCWFLMTFPGYRGYSLSHQPFYLQIGSKVGCFPAKSPLDSDSIQILMDSFCASMKQEAIEIEAGGFPEDGRDLFMEDQAICGVSGYHSFFNSNWLQTILSWQLPSGCWGTEPPKHPGSHVRVKRREKELEKGCLSHRTAVALGALVQYVRYIIEYAQTSPGSGSTN